MHRINSKDFLRGFGRVLDLRGAVHGRYVQPRHWYRSDGAAMAADWNAVFADLTVAYQRVRQTNRNEDES